jgi:hypothetical protein
MKRAVTRELYRYWDALRGPRPLPDYAELHPDAMRGCLANAFVLDCAPGHPFRLAGTSVCRLFGHELKGIAFSALWSAAGGPAMEHLLQCVFAETVGAVISATGRNATGETLEAELLLLPVTAGQEEKPRVIGTLCPVALPYWIDARPLVTLHGGDPRYLGAAHDAGNMRRLVSGQNNPLRGRGFVVYPARLGGMIPRQHQG